MIYTENIQKAIRLAIETHEVCQKQKRKGKDIPFIVHPLTVGIILARAGMSEDVVIAGILHDTIEDSPAEQKVTREMIEEMFGSEVARLVAAVTEEDKNMPWEDRKAEALAHIDHMKNDEIVLKSADVLANIADSVDDFQKDGDRVFEGFNAPKEKVFENYLKLIEKLSRFPNNPLGDDLRALKNVMSQTTSKKNSRCK